MKKGFTVVELLAIIIILAVISLITYSVIQRNIDVTKKSSFEISVKHVIEAAKEYVVTNYEDNEFPEGGIDITNNELDIKNSEFISGIILKDEDGVIRVVNLTDGKMCANGTKNSLDITPGSCEAADETPPALDIKVIKKTSSKVRFLVKMQDAQSGLNTLTYCSGDCENKSEIELPDKRSMVKKVIEVVNLEAGKTYKFKFTVKNNLESDNEEMTTTTIEKEVELPEVEEPIFKVSSGSFATTKHIKIIYPELDEYEYSYYTNSNPENINVLESGKYEADFDIGENTEITARISKDGNIIIESSLTVAGLDLEPPTTYVYIENKDSWALTKKMYVKSVDEGSGLALRGYSMDNKKSWKKASNGVIKTFSSNQSFTLKSRDRVGNIQEKFRLCEDKNFLNCGDERDSFTIRGIDNEPPIIEFKITSGNLGKNSWYISNVGIYLKITDQYSKVTDEGNVVKTRGGSGLNMQDQVVTLNGASQLSNTIQNNDTEIVINFVVNKNSASNKIIIEAKDKVGNKSTYSTTIKKDAEHPVINVSGGCKSSTDILSRFSVKYGVSGGTFNCDIPKITLNATHSLTCEAVSGAGLSAAFNGSVSAPQQSSTAALGEGNRYNIESIKKIDVYVRAISGHSYINPDVCDSYGDASSTLKTYGVKSNGATEEISGASASISVKRNASSGCDCSHNPSTCSGSTAGKCKSKTITYTVTDGDRSKYKSIYFVHTFTKVNPTPCDSERQTSMKWPSANAKVTLYSSGTYCINEN